VPYDGHEQQERQALVEYVEEERSLWEQRERRQSAPVWRRVKWRLLGAPTDDRREA
jgi:hypothetical protein